MNCPNCQTLNPDGARFCLNCGNLLTNACNNCGASLPIGARFCTNCGHRVAPETISPSQPESSTPLEVDEDLLQRFIPRELLAKLEAARLGQRMEGERRVGTSSANPARQPRILGAFPQFGQPQENIARNSLLLLAQLLVEDRICRPGYRPPHPARSAITTTVGPPASTQAAWTKLAIKASRSLSSRHRVNSSSN